MQHVWHEHPDSQNSHNPAPLKGLWPNKPTHTATSHHMHHHSYFRHRWGTALIATMPQIGSNFIRISPTCNTPICRHMPYQGQNQHHLYGLSQFYHPSMYIYHFPLLTHILYSVIMVTKVIFDAYKWKCFILPWNSNKGIMREKIIASVCYNFIFHHYIYQSPLLSHILTNEIFRYYGNKGII